MSKEIVPVAGAIAGMLGASALAGYLAPDPNTLLRENGLDPVEEPSFLQRMEENYKRIFDRLTGTSEGNQEPVASGEGRFAPVVNEEPLEEEIKEDEETPLLTP